jgi:hypothetical protein
MRDRRSHSLHHIRRRGTLRDQINNSCNAAHGYPTTLTVLAAFSRALCFNIAEDAEEKSFECLMLNQPKKTKKKFVRLRVSSMLKAN